MLQFPFNFTDSRVAKAPLRFNKLLHTQPYQTSKPQRQ